MEEKDLTFNIPDKKTIPCLTCKHGMINFLAMYCAKYKVKPNNVYYNSEPCENYEPIDK